MAYCIHCGKQLPDGAKFCAYCGKSMNLETGPTPVREQVYAGNVIKCPACGAEVNSFLALCTACGHEINSRKLSPSVSQFIHSLNECDKRIAEEPKMAKVKNGWSTWSKGWRIGWVILNIFTSCIPLAFYLLLPFIKPLFVKSAPILSPEEQKKASLIENVAFPNEREALLEALIFIKSKMAYLASEKYNVKTAFWIRLWNVKACQLYQKAKYLLKGDEIADDSYEMIQQSKAKVEKRVHMRAGASTLTIVALFLFVVINGSLLSGIVRLMPAGNHPSLATSDSHSSDIKFQWLETGLSNRLPSIEANSGEYKTNSDTELELSLQGLSYSQFENYIADCQNAGYQIDATKDTKEYVAYDGDGYYLELYYREYREEINIILKAPLKGNADFQWPTHNFAKLIPELTGKSGKIETSTEEKLTFLLYDVSADEFLNYNLACETYGFTIDTEKKATSFYGFNSDGYKLVISLGDMKDLSITIEAPIKFSKIKWPTSGPATLIPKPSHDLGKISSDYDWAFSVYLSEMTVENFDSYVEDCLSKGFEKEFRSEHYFSAKKGNDISLTVEYQGFNTVWISIHNMNEF